MGDALVVALAMFLRLSPIAGTAMASTDDPRDGGTAVIGADQEPVCLNVLRGRDRARARQQPGGR
jgi:hypothetical protein